MDGANFKIDRFFSRWLINVAPSKARSTSFATAQRATSIGKTSAAKTRQTPSTSEEGGWHRVCCYPFDRQRNVANPWSAKEGVITIRRWWLSQMANREEQDAVSLWFFTSDALSSVNRGGCHAGRQFVGPAQGCRCPPRLSLDSRYRGN